MRKRGMAFLLAGCLACGSIAAYAQETESEGTSRKATIVVVSITGNELTYYEVEEESDGSEAGSSEAGTESSEETPAKAGTEDGKETSAEVETENGEEVPDEAGTESGEEASAKAGTESGEEASAKAGTESGEEASSEAGNMPEGFDPTQKGDGEALEGFDPTQKGNREMPEGIDPTQKGNGEMPEGFDPAQMGDGEVPEGIDPTQMGGMKREDTKTIYVPVAVPVHTDTDETMTFSILEAGDELEVLFEEKDGEEIITEIWLLDAAGTDAENTDTDAENTDTADTADTSAKE